MRFHVLAPLALAFLLAACGRDAPASGARGPIPASSPPITPPPKALASGPGEAAGVRYLERTTGSAKPDEPLPLLVAIHGLGDRPESFVSLFDGLGARARLIVPYGLDPFGQGYSWFPISSGDEALLARGTEHAANRLAAMIDALVRSRPTLGKPIVTGFSQGGMLSFTLAVLHPEIIGAAYPMGGLLAAPLRPRSWPMGKTQPEIHAFHGATDARVPVAGARASLESLRAIGFAAELREYPGVGHAVPPTMQRDLRAALEAALERAAPR